MGLEGVSNLQSIGDYQLNAELFEERDGSITLGMREIDLCVNAPSKEQAVRLLAADLLEYAQEYCQQIHLWHSAPNRKPHLPYVLRVLSLKIRMTWPKS